MKGSFHVLTQFIGQFGYLFGNADIVGFIFFIEFGFQLVQVSALVSNFLKMA